MLGIFEGKKAEYNKLILKGLIYGAKTTNQIGEFIYFNREAQIKPRKANLNEVKKLVSIISRKGGRLKELEFKGYIFREKGCWRLTLKGTAVALTLFDDLSEVYPYIRTDLTVKAMEKAFREFGVAKALKEYGLNDWASKVFRWVKNQKNFLSFVRDSTNELISKLTDLDSLSEDEFRNLLVIRGVQKFFKSHLAQIEEIITELVLKGDVKRE